jgi:hypothetical protein
MDQDLKEYLDANFGRVDERFVSVDQRLTDVEQRFTEMAQRIEKVETSLLGAFYGWARPMEFRSTE